MTYLMGTVGDAISWLAGSGRYMTLVHCMDGDTFWIALTLVLDLAVASGYVLIARHWGRNERLLSESPSKSALGTMKRIFILCGLCGYLFIPIKMLWPAWRLYDLSLAILVFYTWRYALGAHQLRVVYEELDRSAQLMTQLERSREDARRRSIFLSSISHDIRTPLNALSLNAELAEVCLADGDAEALRQALDDIRACARTAADLLGEFLEIGRIDWAVDTARRDRHELDAILARVVDANQALAATKGLALSIEGEAGLVVETDRRMLERVLQNLIENGLKYTEVGGVRVLVSSMPKSVSIQVADTGIGIADKDQALIFEDFYQVENRERDRTKGFGLGLSIASRLIAQLGGELHLESQLGRGSRFVVTLPRVEAGEPSRAEHCDRADCKPAASASLAR